MSKSSSEATEKPERAFCEWRVWTVTVMVTIYNRKVSGG